MNSHKQRSTRFVSRMFPKYVIFSLAKNEQVLIKLKLHKIEEKSEDFQELNLL